MNVFMTNIQLFVLLSMLDTEIMHDETVRLCMTRQWDYALLDTVIMHHQTLRLCITRHCDYALLDTEIMHY